jgi:uncharacterized protein (TIGR04255 family)
MSNKQYLHPPVEEAICEFHFLHKEEWDMLLPALYREQIKDVYSGKPRTQNLVEAELGYSQQLNESGITFKQGITRYLFSTPDEINRVGIAPNILSVHFLHPYGGWEKFYHRIQGALRKYLELAKPSGVLRISLRYINRIKIPFPEDGHLSLETYFAAPPSVPESFSKNLLTSFSLRNEFLYGEDKPVRLTVSFSDLKTPDPTLSEFLLDIEASEEWAPDDNLTPAIDDILEALNKLKNSESEVFETFVTDEMRRLFDGYQN